MADDRKLYNFPGNARSDVWKHFGFYAVDDNAESIQVDRSKAICKICRLAIKNHGNTTNLYNHVTKRHGQELALEFQVKMFREPRFQCVPSSSLEFDTLINSRSSIVTKAICEYIVDDLRPISSVQTPAFKTLLFTMDPKYELPANDFLGNIHFLGKYEETKQKVLQEIQQNSNGSSMMVDIWSSSVTWASLSIQFINNSWTTKSFLLKSIQIPAEPDMKLICEMIENCTDEWNTSNPVSVVSCNKFCRSSPNSSWYSIPCLANTMNNAALKSFEVPEVWHLIDKASNLIRYLENHFQHVVCNLDPVNIDRSRWLSTYEMFQWLSTNTPIIEEILCGSDTKAMSLELLFTSEEQIVTENLLFAFKELKTATNILCEEPQPLISMILPILQKLLTSFSSMESDSCIIGLIKKTVHEVLSQTYQYEPNNVNIFLVCSSLLDPRYKELPFITNEKRNEAKEIIFSKALDAHIFYESRATSNSETSTDRQFADIKVSNPKKMKIEPNTSSSLDDWFSDVVCEQNSKENTDLDKVSTEFNKFQFTDRMSANSDPLAWWKKHEILFPILSRIAKNFLCTPATSVPANHVFTSCGQKYEVSRSMLSASEVNKLVFLNKNNTLITQNM